MQRIFLLLVIVVVGAAVMAPVFMFLELEPQPWDFVLEIAGRPEVPVANGAVYPLVNSVARGKEWEHRFGPIPWKGAWGGLGSIDGVPATEPPVLSLNSCVS